MPLITRFSVSRIDQRDEIEKEFAQLGYSCKFRTFLTDMEGEITGIIHVWERLKKA